MPGRVGEVRVAADEPEAVASGLARRLESFPGSLGMPREPSVLFDPLASRLELIRFPRVAPLGAASPQKRGGEGPADRNDRGVRGSPGRRRGAAHSTWEVARSRLFLAERCRTSIKNVDFSI